MNRRICVITGSRAEYGLLRWLMQDIKDADDFELQLIVTGSHLSPEFGLTYHEVEADGFYIDHKVDILLSSDSKASVVKSMGLALLGFADAFSYLKPDILVLLGDRYEILSAASAALVMNIPVAHLHGGELTEGAIDDSIRHAVTKMSHLHFVAMDQYRDRVIQLGEQPDNVYVVGGLGLDNIRRIQLLDEAELESEMKFEFGNKNLLITYHPVTLDDLPIEKQMQELFSALDSLEGTNLIFTMPNADAGGHVIKKMIEDYVASRSNAVAYASLGQVKYLSCISHVDGVIGNSSSGLIEVPSFCKGTVNIGSRQDGRIRAPSVIDCQPDSESIKGALNKLYDPVFKKSIEIVRNPYGDGGASEKIVDILRSCPLKGVLKKQFFNLPVANYSDI